MSMTLMITRNLPSRFHGFLSSCMLELAPGVYAAPRMKKSVRQRVWHVMLEWAQEIGTDGGVVMFWPDRNAPSGMGISMLGWPKKELIDHEGVWLTHSPLTSAHDLTDLDFQVAPEEA